MTRHLREAALAVLNNWERGDLARAVNLLEAALRDEHQQHRLDTRYEITPEGRAHLDGLPR